MNHAEALEFLRNVDPMKPRMLRGDAGIGKDALVQELGLLLKLPVLELPLSELEPPDVIGLPYIEKQEDCWPGSGRWVKSTAYARPHWWPTEPLILFLNELDLASEMMFPAAMRLADRRMAGQLKLPDGVVIFAAVNGERYNRNPLDQALLRRFAVIDYKPTVDEWLEWAVRNYIHASVIDYIRETPMALDTPEALVGKRNLVVPTRASWTDFGLHLNRVSAESALIKEKASLYAAPYIGKVAAQNFQDWLLKVPPKLTALDIFEGKADPKQTTLVQASSVIGAAAGRFMSVDKTRQHAALDFYLAMGSEAFAAFFTELPKDASPVVRKYSPANEMISKIVGAL